MEKFSIGRSANNDLYFNDVSVSRRHAELFMTEKGIQIVDLGSKYGTHVYAPKIPFFTK